MHACIQFDVTERLNHENSGFGRKSMPFTVTQLRWQTGLDFIYAAAHSAVSKWYHNELCLSLCTHTYQWR